MRTQVTVLTIIASLIFVGCTSTETKITYGPVSGTGTLIPAELSLVRRGTHLLIMNSGKKYYVESKTENLQSLEGLTVFIEGRLEKNTKNTDPPVIVVEKIKGDFTAKDLHIWNIPALNLRVQTPNTWKGTLSNGDAMFSLATETEPLLTIRSMSGSDLPPGHIFYVQNRKAVSTENGGVVRELYIQENQRVIRIHFDPTTQTSITSTVEAKILQSQFERMLSSLVFIKDDSQKNRNTSSGSLQGCGGIAKILCSDTEYCDITDQATGTGMCKPKPTK